MTRRSASQYNFAKLEFDETILPASPQRSSARTESIQFVVIHHMTIKGSGDGAALTACSNTWKTREASAHYGVDGKLIRQYVWDNRAAWATANHHGNHAGISIEHANSSLSPSWQIAADTMATSARLVANLHKVYKLGRPVSGKTLKRHHDFYATACPGPYFDSHWAAYVQQAQHAYDELSKTTTAPAPPVAEPKVVLEFLHWNIAGSDDQNGYGASNGYRGPMVGAWAKDIGFDVFTACEASQHDLRAGVSTGIGIPSWESYSKAIWRQPEIKLLAPRKAYADTTYNYLKTVKYGAAIFGEKKGKKFSILEIHTDYRKPAKQAKQVESLFLKWRADTDKLGIHHLNTFVVGDFNWDYTSGDNPFKALQHYNLEEKGSRTDATFLDGRHLDGILAHIEANVKVERPDRANKAGVRLSDHFPRKGVAVLH